MKIPTSVLIAIAVLVVAMTIIVAFFTMAGGGAARRTELQTTFTQNCIAICAMPDRGTINLAAAYPQWQSACEQLYGIPTSASAQCLERCECARLAGPCEFLCRFENTVSDWLTFCEHIRTHSSTQATYGNCDCEC